MTGLIGVGLFVLYALFLPIKTHRPRMVLSKADARRLRLHHFCESYVLLTLGRMRNLTFS